jgi:hypothetical protein
VVCNFNSHVLAAGTSLSAAAVHRFEALPYASKRSADIDLLTSWLDLKLGAKCGRGKDAILQMAGRRLQHPTN